jgi:hypothetical protein
VKRPLTPPVAIGAATVLLLAASLVSVVLWARNIGMAEDWFMVPAMTGHQADLLSWLWSQNNEHRLPVQRLIYLGLLSVTGDFRSGMVVSQLLLAVLALALAGAAGAARGGRWRWSDLLFPLALLHLGHWENQVWGWQIQFVWSVFLTGSLLAIVMACAGPVAPWMAWAAAMLLLLVAVSGANGIVFAAAMAPWMLAQAMLRLRLNDDRSARRLGIVLIGAVVVALGLIGVYFIGYERPPWSPPPPTAGQFLRAAGMYFAYALGPAARWSPLPAAAIVLLILAGGGILAARAVLLADREDRPRALGLVLFIGAGIALGLAIAWGRGANPGRMPDRYALLSVLPLVSAAFAWELYTPKWLGRRVALGLAVLLALMMPLNVHAGFKWRDWYVDGMRKVEADIDGGVPIPELAARHYPFLMHWSEDRLRTAMHYLHDAGIGPLSSVPPD